ncbi:hypothetical protein D3C81_1775620 [compost metagenome]
MCIRVNVFINEIAVCICDRLSIPVGLGINRNIMPPHPIIELVGINVVVLRQFFELGVTLFRRFLRKISDISVSWEMRPIARNIDCCGRILRWRISLNPRFRRVAAEILSRRRPTHCKLVVSFFQYRQRFVAFGNQGIQLINLQMQLAAPIGRLIEGQNQLCGFTRSESCL